MSRRRVFAANWKMNHGPTQAADFFDRFLPLVPPAPGRDLWFFPPGVSIQAAARALADRPDARVGAQNIYWEPRGAYTGELSVDMVADAGAQGALVGHSERRHQFGESYEETRRKVAALLDGGLVAVLCVGERLEERQAGRTEAVVVAQLEAALSGVPADRLGRLLLAYEPVWAIGTGHTATPRDAAAVHRVIRATLDARGVPDTVPILYGGSVNAENVAALVAEPEVDGVLVGGASLLPEGWAGLVRSGGG